MTLPLFVYGTLRSTGRGRSLLQGRHRGEAWIRGTLWDLPAGYPAVTLHGDGDGTVHGEWTDPVPPDLLARLDDYEGVAEGLYRRVPVVVHAGDAVFEAWSWVMDDPARRGGVVVSGGVWGGAPARSARRDGR